MPPQIRTFIVETKSRRASPQGTLGGLGRDTIDDVPPNELPSRGVRDDVATSGIGAAFEAANRLFRTAMSPWTAATGPEERNRDTSATLSSAQASAIAAVLADDAPQQRGRILPSLIPLNPFEAADQAVASPEPRKRGRPSGKAPKLVKAEVAVVGAATEILPTEEPSRASKVRYSRRRRAERRVPAGERWKRRRLPKALW